LATARRIAIPAVAASRDQRDRDRLARLDGVDFDRAYVQQMIRAHDRDVKALERAMKSERDSDVKDWLTRTLAILQEHDRRALDRMAELKGQKASSPSALPKMSDRW